MQKPQFKSALYILPYIGLLILGIWYRTMASGLAYFDGDSGGYLLPPIQKAITGFWFKGERPMQYLFFIYYTMSGTVGLKSVVIAQQVLAIIGACFLTGAWLIFIKRFTRNLFLWHLLGYIMIAIYVSSPILMYFEQAIGPESMCISLMCILIFCLTAGTSAWPRDKLRVAFLSAAVFLNLYLANPMPKMVFVSVFLEVLLVGMILKNHLLSRKAKTYLLLLPHALYALIVVLPERTHNPDSPEQDRVYIEYKQLVYTHFDLLAQDKSNFEVAPWLQDSLVEWYRQSLMENQLSNNFGNYLMGFVNDYLMWGPANKAIYNYYGGNTDSIAAFYKGLSWKLVTKYPLGFAGHILKQVLAFYIPNKILHKRLYNDPNLAQVYKSTMEQIKEQDPKIDSFYRKQHVTAGPAGLLAPAYPPTFKGAGIKTFAQYPLPYAILIGADLLFDFLFILSMAGAFAVKIYQKKIFEPDIVNILNLSIFIYVLTISIVHTFDVGRFITTIYPLLLTATLMSFAYLADFVMGRAVFVKFSKLLWTSAIWFISCILSLFITCNSWIEKCISFPAPVISAWWPRYGPLWLLIRDKVYLLTYSFFIASSILLIAQIFYSKAVSLNKIAHFIRARKKELLLFSLSIIISLGIAEAILRQLGYKPGHFHLINTSSFTEVDTLIDMQTYQADEHAMTYIDPALASKFRAYIRANANTPDLPTNMSDVPTWTNVASDYCTMPLDYISVISGRDTGEFSRFYNSVKNKAIKDSFDSLVLNYTWCPINNDGFKSINFRTHSGKKRILLIGDSFIFGMSATKSVYGCADLLLSRGYEVYNTGLPGSDPPQYLAVAEKYIPLLKPDLVIVNFFLGNDVQYYRQNFRPFQPFHYMTNGGIFSSCPQGVPLKNSREAYNLTLDYNMIPDNGSLLNTICRQTVITALLWKCFKGDNPEWFSRESKKYLLSYPDANDRIPQIKRLCEANHCRYILCVIPALAPDNSRNLKHVRDFYQLFAQQEYLECNEMTESDYVTGSDFHFNNKGQHKYAGFLQGVIDSVFRSN